jgi:hypothetical protein
MNVPGTARQGKCAALACQYRFQHTAPNGEGFIGDEAAKHGVIARIHIAEFQAAGHGCTVAQQSA